MSVGSEIISETVKLAGVKSFMIITKYSKVIELLKDSLYPDELAESLVENYKDGVSERVWIRHIERNREANR